MVWAATTHQGCVRSANEDAILAGPRIFAVADGVGGAIGGREASTTTIAKLARADHAGTFDADVLLTAIRSANAEIVARRQRGTMGTTLAGIALCGQFDGQQFVLFNIGDSRVYRMRDGELSQLSVDHSVVAAQLHAGEITGRAGARPPRSERHHPSHRRRGRAGCRRAAFVPRVADRYLVCTDGLTNEVTDDEIAALLSTAADGVGAGSGAARASARIRARDNVSVVIADVVSVASDGLTDEPTHRRSTLGRARRRRRCLPRDENLPVTEPIVFSSPTAVLAMDVSDGEMVRRTSRGASRRVLARHGPPRAGGPRLLGHA